MFQCLMSIYQVIWAYFIQINTPYEHLERKLIFLLVLTMMRLNKKGLNLIYKTRLKNLDSLECKNLKWQGAHVGSAS